MSGSLTVGGGGTTVSASFGNSSNFQLAQQIADAITAASIAGTLNATVVAAPGPIAPPTGSGSTLNELIITGGGVYTIPAAGAGANEWLVVLDNSAPVTIYGAANSTIWGGNAGVTIIDPAIITIAEDAGNATATINGSGDVLAGNNFNDTLTAAGVNGSITGGTGTNLFYALGANDTITAQGKGDTIVGGGGSSTFQLLGPSGTVTGAQGASVVGGAGSINVTDAGTSNTIYGGSGAAFVTLTGSAASVVGGLGALSVVDSGVGDTIKAGVSYTTITATGSSYVEGGAGLLNFVGGAGNSTIVGGSGDASIFGAAGGTTLFGGSGQSATYVDTVGVGVYYLAPTGNATLDASLSNGAHTIFGGSDSTGGALLVGGAVNDLLQAGSGADTLIGGGGQDAFSFWTSHGGPGANHIIADFSAIDLVALGDYGPDAAAAAIAGATTSGNSTTITLSDNTKITFTGVTSSAALTGHIFSA